MMIMEILVDDSKKGLGEKGRQEISIFDTLKSIWLY